MKRILFFILIIICCASCNKAKTELKKDIELSNSLECPYEIDAYTILTSVELKNNYVVYNCTVDENYYSIQLMNDNKAINKEIIKGYSSSVFNIDHIHFIELCKSANCGIKYVFKGHITGQTCIITFEHGEL